MEDAGTETDLSLLTAWKGGMGREVGGGIGIEVLNFLEKNLIVFGCSRKDEVVVETYTVNIISVNLGT
jgi:hypothetical protein